MRLWDPAFLAAKVTAVAVFALGLRFVPTTVRLLFYGRRFEADQVAGVVQVALMLGFAVLLWRGADSFAGRISREADAAIPGEAEQPLRSWARADILTVALAVIGVYLVVTGVPELVGNILRAISPRSSAGFPYPIGQGAFGMDLRKDSLIGASTDLVQITIGLWLMFDNGPLTRIMGRARTSPADTPDLDG